jgi:hypothetical protein
MVEMKLVMVEMKPVMVEMKLVMVEMKPDMVEIHFDQKASFRRLHFDMSGLWRQSRIFNPLPLILGHVAICGQFLDVMP